MSQAFIIDWTQDKSHPEELHAIALVKDDVTANYSKSLIRIPFSDFAYILFGEDPEPALIDRARRSVGSRATMRISKVKTIAGYQPKPTVTALMLRSADLSLVLKDPTIKALGGYIEEHTAISRSRKLTALRGMPQCCWISLSGMSVVSTGDPDRITRDAITEYKLSNWQEFTALPLDNRSAFTPPPTDNISVVSFDIEVYKPSQRGGGMPDADDRSNFVMCISTITNPGRKTSIHTIYDIKETQLLPKGTIIRRYDTEYAMIRGFWDYVAEENPAFLIGFNVQSWDFRYLNSRMKIHGITYPNSLSIYRKPSAIEMRKAHWASDAFKNNDMLWPDIPGIVVLDLHKFYLRTRPSLRKHSLDYISRHYIGRGKLPMSQGRMVDAYESGDPDELSAMAQYNIEDSVLVLDIFLSQHVFEEAAIEAITSETLIDDLYTKGMQVRALNKLYRYAKEEGYVVTTSPALSIARGQGGGGGESQLAGALVQGGSPGRYDDVAVYDIRSMYPTLLMSKNICYTTFLASDEDKAAVQHETFPWETKGGNPEAPHSVHEASFVTSNVMRGICPRMLTDQLTLRDQIKSWGSDEVGILRYAQRSVKAVSNSLIGLMGAIFETSRLSFPAAAGVVYTAGRQSITEIIHDVSTWEGGKHGDVVYSDTDSVLVANMPSQESRRLLLEYLNNKYAPFSFELETVGRLLLIGPKNYIMRLNDDGSLVYKGVTFSRRNSSDYISQAMHQVTSMIMDSQHSRAEILEVVKGTIEGVAEHPIDDFVMSATVSVAAKSIGGKLGRRLIANGAILMPGDVVDYVVLEKPLSEIRGCETTVVPSKSKKAKTKKSGVTDRTATVEELEKCPGASIDFEYYTDKLRTSVDQLLVFD